MFKTEKNNKKTAIDKYPIGYLIPFIAILTFIPAIIYMYKYDTGLTKYSWYTGPGTTLDFFLHAKMFWLYITFIVILFVMVYMVFSEEMKLKFNKIFIPLFTYCGLCFLSAFTSIDSHYSFTGIYEQFESVWILLGYGLITYFSFYVFCNENAIHRILPWFIGGMCYMAVLGLLQTLKYDPFRYTFIQKLFITDSKQVGKLAFSFEKGQSYLTLYNPNYIGMYIILTIPILLGLIIYTKKIALKIFYGILTITLLLVLFSSQSRAGIAILIVVFLFLLICMRKIFFKKWWITLAVVGLFIACFLGINAINNNILINRISSMFKSGMTDYELQSIEANKDVTFGYKGNKFHITTEVTDNNQTYKVLDQDNKALQLTPSTTEKNTFVINDERFPFTITTISEETFKGFYVTTDIPKVVDGQITTVKRQWIFSNQMITNDKSYYYKGYGNSFFHIKSKYDGIKFFDERYSLASNRGYIWSRTIPLLKKYFFLGSGPDTFIIAFPNDDVVGAYNSNHDNEIFTKPHNLFLQIATQTGVPSLIAFLVFFGWYIIGSIRIYWNADYSKFKSIIGVCVLSSVIGYLILGFTNDSCITVSPIFFTLTGMGIGINYAIKKV